MKNILKVSDLYIYPIKSLGGIRMESAQALTEGFENDRRMMLVNEDGRFLTQREHHIMALFKLSIHQDICTVTYGESQVRIPMGSILPNTQKVSVWKSELEAYEISEEVNEWFSHHLNDQVRLVKMGPKSVREKAFQKPPFSSTVSLADGYPYLLLGDQSLKQLNDKCWQSFDINRFRANVVVQSFVPHEEDALEDFEIGTAQFKNIKPCARCVMITVDQYTAETSKEPLATLSKYRKEGNMVYFGTNLICTREGTVSEGDTIKVM